MSFLLQSFPTLTLAAFLHNVSRPRLISNLVHSGKEHSEWSSHLHDFSCYLTSPYVPLYLCSSTFTFCFHKVRLQFKWLCTPSSGTFLLLSTWNDCSPCFHLLNSNSPSKHLKYHLLQETFLNVFSLSVSCCTIFIVNLFSLKTKVL